MDKYEFKSLLKKEMADFVELRKVCGLCVTNETVLRVLDQFLEQYKVSNKALTYQLIDAWIAESYGNMNPNTAKNYISHYIQFAKYLNSQGIGAFIPLTSYYKQTYSPYIFSEVEIESIFEVADNLTISKRAHTTAAISQIPMLLRILYGCGLRLGEALKLKIADIDIEQSFIWIRSAKGNKDRIVPFESTLHVVLVKYCDRLLKDNPAEEFLFKGDARPYHVGHWAMVWFRQILNDAGIEKIDSGSGTTKTRGICLNCLRHTFAVNSLRQQIALGIDTYRSVPMLSIYLGHKKLRGTMRYMHMTAENSEEIAGITAEYTKGIFPEVPL